MIFSIYFQAIFYLKKLKIEMSIDVCQLALENSIIYMTLNQNS